MSVLVAEQLLVDAVLEAFREFATAVYERDGLPTVTDPAFSEVEVTRRPGEHGRFGGPASIFGLYTLTERSTSKFAATLREHRDQIAEIEGVTITVDGVESTPVAFDNADPITPDDGMYVGFRTWTFAMFPTA